MNCTRKFLLSVLFLFIIPVIIHAESSLKIIINEFLASNSTGLQDEDDEYSDWIELYNTGSSTINMQGWRLTDSGNKPSKWIFPSVSIRAGEYLVVFASGKDKIGSNGELHTNFSLSKDGEYLAVIEPDGTISDEYAPTFPPQQNDISYGYYQGQRMYFEIPTPGAVNNPETKAHTPVFSVNRGFYDDPFSVSLTVSDSDTRIYYTMDGTRPTIQSTLYTGPVPITKTTPLSAVGVKGETSSSIVTNTYFFIKDIVEQPADPSGYPDRWGYLGGDVRYDNYAVGERAPADYAMDPNVCNDPLYKNQISDAFLSIPSMGIVTNPGYLFSHSTDENEGGIYIHTGVNLGDGWERPVSLEYYDPSTKKQFQMNCGLKLHGAASRQPEKTGKHSFRLVFRKAYGEGKLRFDLFEKETAVKEFDHLVLRAGYNLSWMHPEESQRRNSQYTIDSFVKKIQLNMGYPSSHNRFVHLFINGLYWGLYDLSERLNDKFMAAYFDAEDTDFDVINHNGLAEGDITAYNRLIELGKAGDYDQLLTEKLLYMENFIDYMLLNFYVGNIDWAHNNWYMARNRMEPGNGFYSFCWDTENSMSDVNINRINSFQGDLRRILFGSYSTWSASNGGLYNNKEFKLLFADRVNKHFFNGGYLTPEKTTELFEEIANEIDKAVILESARWGDYRKNVLTPRNSQPQLYTRDNHWVPRKEYLSSKYFPKRTDIVYEQLKAVGLVSEIDPPVFSSYGENIENPVELTMSTTSGQIYYTTDSTDPRERGSGNITTSSMKYSMPLQIAGECTVKARAKNGTVWSALSEAKFTGGNGSDIYLINDIAQIVYYKDNFLNILLLNEGNMSLDIYSIDGKQIQEINMYALPGNNKIGLSEIPSGVYIYKLSFNGIADSGKFIK